MRRPKGYLVRLRLVGGIGDLEKGLEGFARWRMGCCEGDVVLRMRILRRDLQDER